LWFGWYVCSIIKFIEAHHGNKKEISIYGQEYTNTTYKLAKMNLAIRGISATLVKKQPTLLQTTNTKT
jgi:type I restriction-modification system DNA methylase subunit